MRKTFRYRLYPSRAQERLLAETLETCRHFYNALLAERKEAWEERQESVGRFAQLRRVKTYREGSEYGARVHSHILQGVAVTLDLAFQAFFRRVKAGEKPGYPRFRGRGRFESFGFKEYGNGFRLDGRRLKLSGIGRVPVRWHRAVEGQIKTVRICRRPDGWYACFSCEVETPEAFPGTGREVGIDVGLSALLTTSDGEKVLPPKHYRAGESKLRRLQRALAHKRRGSHRRTKARLRVALHGQHVANQRTDFLKKLCADLVRRFDFIALEDLRIPNMVQNPHLAKSILDASWGLFASYLAYKAEWAGREVAFVDPRNTSRCCSECGSVFEHFDLSVRWVRCACGLSLDRDENAARNILNRAGQARRALTESVATTVAREAAAL